MKDRERILELVKKGVISTEEALVLLESIATAKDERVIEKEASQVKNTNFSETGTSKEEPVFNESEAESSEEKDQKHFEKILEQLATEMNQVSAELDQLNEKLSESEKKKKDVEEKIMVFNTMEELDELAEEKKVERDALESELQAMNVELEELYAEKAILEIQLRDLRKEQRSEKVDEWSSKFEIPEDWRETADVTMKKVGENVSEVGSQIGRMLKKTINTVTGAVQENVDWKDINIKVPGVATTKFTHTFFYPEVAATILDVKVANGEIIFKQWDQNDLKVEAEIKLYGKMEADSPFEAFLERSQIDVDDDRISFQVPNKRIRATLVFYLPTRVYDHVSVKMLNGKISVDELEGKDVYVKSTNGDMNFKNLSATMLEVEGVNGNVKFENGEILDLLIETMNGDIIVRGDADNLNATSMNGDVKITSSNNQLHKIEASVVNGTVKVALPMNIGLDVTAKTSLGSINHKMSNIDIIREKKEKTNQLLEFRRISGESTANVRLKTTTGSIFIKDVE